MSWHEGAAAAAPPATGHEQKVDATDVRTRLSDGGDEPRVVGASVPVRAELPQPVVSDVVAKTEHAVRRETGDGLET